MSSGRINRTSATLSVKEKIKEGKRIGGCFVLRKFWLRAKQCRGFIDNVGLSRYLCIGENKVFKNSRPFR